MGVVAVLMRTVFFGSPPFAEASFAALFEVPGVEVVGLVTSPARRSGRGRRETQNPLVELAEAKGVAVFRPDKASAAGFVAELSALRADLGVVVSYGQLLTQEVLDTPVLGCVNVHGSLLPRWRGASPVQAALLAGEKETGVCVQKMVLALDAGPVLAQERCAINENETGPSLFSRLALASARLLKAFLVDAASWMKKQSLPLGEEQNTEGVSFCKKVKKQDGLLDWSKPALELERKVRAYAGWPCGQTCLPDGAGLKIYRAELHSMPSSEAGSPGEVLQTTPQLIVACGEGSLVLLELQKEGKGVMPADDFLRGAKLKAGDVLGVSKTKGGAK